MPPRQPGIGELSVALLVGSALAGVTALLAIQAIALLPFMALLVGGARLSRHVMPAVRRVEGSLRRSVIRTDRRAVASQMAASSPPPGSHPSP